MDLDVDDFLLLLSLLLLGFLFVCFVLLLINDDQVKLMTVMIF